MKWRCVCRSAPAALRLAGQLLTESLLLAVLGGAGGLGLAWVLIRIAPRLVPEGGLPAGLLLSLDLRVVAFTILITLAAGLLFGLAPAWQLTSGSLAGAMRGGGRGVAGGSNRLLGDAGHGGNRDRRHRRLWRRALPPHPGPSQPGGSRFPCRTGPHHAACRCRSAAIPHRRMRWRSIRPRSPKSRRLPGVRSASFGGSLPLTGFDIGQGVQIVGQTQPEPGLQFLQRPLPDGRHALF